MKVTLLNLDTLETDLIVTKKKLGVDEYLVINNGFYMLFDYDKFADFCKIMSMYHDHNESEKDIVLTPITSPESLTAYAMSYGNKWISIASEQSELQYKMNFLKSLVE